MRVSTHAPRAGSDQCGRRFAVRPRRFNSRSPCGERLPAGRAACPQRGFQLTLPVRGATATPRGWMTSLRRFNSRSPCGERHAGAHPLPADAAVSTHAPRAGSDPCAGSDGRIKGVSTHAPRAGSDAPRNRREAMRTSFQLTLPVRGATRQKKETKNKKTFQLTLPVRGATRDAMRTSVSSAFQLTLPVRGATAEFCHCSF